MGGLEKEAAFQLAVQAYADTVYRVAVHACPRRADAEDVVQDTYEKLLRWDKGFESETHLKAWLIRVTLNRCHDLARAASGRDLPLEDSVPAAPEDGSRVLDAVRALPENYRSAVYLHYYEGYTAAEIGDMLGAPANTVLSWLARARAQLHTLLQEEIEDEVV